MAKSVVNATRHRRKRPKTLETSSTSASSMRPSATKCSTTLGLFTQRPRLLQNCYFPEQHPLPPAQSSALVHLITASSDAHRTPHYAADPFSTLSFLLSLESLPTPYNSGQKYTHASARSLARVSGRAHSHLPACLPAWLNYPKPSLSKLTKM